MLWIIEKNEDGIKMSNKTVFPRKIIREVDMDKLQRKEYEKQIKKQRRDTREAKYSHEEN
jgi:hypothetical protein